MRAVNLLPRDEPRARRSLPGPWVMAAAVAPLLAGSLVYLGYSAEHSTVLDRKAELSAVQVRLDKLRAGSSGAAARQSGLVGQRAQRQVALLDALTKTMPWDTTLADLARVMPSDVWVTTLTAQSPTPAGVAASTTGAATAVSTSTGPALNPTAFTLAGYAHSQGAVAHLLARLQLLPMLNNVTLGSTTSTVTPAGQETVQFQLTAAVKPMPTGAAS